MSTIIAAKHSLGEYLVVSVGFAAEDGEGS